MKRIYLEITNCCNLNCPFCTENKGQRFLNLTEIDNYTNQIKEVCDYIYLHVLGEPLLHPNFDEILSMLDDKDINLQLVTNGTLLHKYPDIFKHQCLRKLSISLHSINHLKIDKQYFEVIDELINSNHQASLELRFYYPSSLDDSLRTYLNSLYQRFNIKETSKTSSFKLKDNTYIYFQEFFTWPNMNHPFISDIGKCHGLIDQLAILSNGDVSSCCLDPLGINALGNLKKNTLKDILNSKKYLDTVKALKDKKLILPLCQHCSYHNRFK